MFNLIRRQVPLARSYFMFSNAKQQSEARLQGMIADKINNSTINVQDISDGVSCIL